jgi:diguanylate cyclase (GGDEF)-like protein/PAS domain S-box-containing protein
MNRFSDTARAAEETAPAEKTALRVIIVEDSEDDAQLLMRYLRRGGYDPTAVRIETAEEMKRLLDGQPWDLIIADYSLPHFNAVLALSVLNEKGLDVPFIILSGTIGEETAVEAMRAGAHDYIMKGSSARLLPAIERELREAGERATRRNAQLALKQNERRFRSLIEYSSDITTVVDREGTILYESPSVERLLGHSAGDLVGANLSGYVHPDDLGRVMTAILPTSHDGAPSVEFRFKKQSGDWRSLEANITHLLDNPDVAGIVLNCRDITARKTDEATIRHLAYFDALTSLPNRTLFNDRLAQALAHARRHDSRGLAVMFFDLDRFKTINDTLGHGAGDELLRTTAERLAAVIREEDTVARLGGDEFLFLLPGIDDVEDAARVAQKLLDAFGTPFNVQNHELHVTASIGISLFPADGGDGETLIRNADTALYRAKEQGRNRYQLYAPAMNAVAFKRLVIENSLRRAMERNELSLYYQPLVSMDDTQTVAVEGLLRWKHPELGLVSPADFIPTAEETGLIVPLTRWVLRTACVQMKEWQRMGVAPDSVSVNVSGRRFNDSNLPEMIADVLQATELDGSALTIELTESVMMENAEATIATLQQLKRLGIKISIDDFGTGYSSLSYLKRLPIDSLKIDQSFVRDIPGDTEGASIATVIITMAHNLRLSVVAEGVETGEQMSFLREKSCDIMQGYFISRPLETSAATDFLTKKRRG